MKEVRPDQIDVFFRGDQSEWGQRQVVGTLGWGSEAVLFLSDVRSERLAQCTSRARSWYEQNLELDLPMQFAVRVRSYHDD